MPIVHRAPHICATAHQPTLAGRLVEVESRLSVQGGVEEEAMLSVTTQPREVGPLPRRGVAGEVVSGVLPEQEQVVVGSVLGEAREAMLRRLMVMDGDGQSVQVQGDAVGARRIAVFYEGGVQEGLERATTSVVGEESGVGGGAALVLEDGPGPVHGLGLGGPDQFEWAGSIRPPSKLCL